MDKDENVMDYKQPADNRSYQPGDTLTRYGAELLIDKIKQYWKDKGKEVHLWVESFMDTKVYTKPMFAIRSNMIGGLPK